MPIRRNDSYPPLDRRLRKVSTSAIITIVGLVACIGLYLVPVPGLGDSFFVTIAVVFAGLFFAIYGLARLVEGAIEYRKYRELRESGNRDPWDSRIEPTEYGPWRPGDP